MRNIKVKFLVSILNLNGILAKIELQYTIQVTSIIKFIEL